ncbi:hypothetical protein HHK36_007891 [Tetracentron sinense]|uniref:Uncharacterized protein n=1 Tax=Tetracentron sinense TaxID=13715 RepID=A0A835DMV8_TETSI|nr:hypothetical protein HHK36_007891 [Tetracentron sinense]
MVGLVLFRLHPGLLVLLGQGRLIIVVGFARFSQGTFAKEMCGTGTDDLLGTVEKSNSALAKKEELCGKKPLKSSPEVGCRQWSCLDNTRTIPFVRKLYCQGNDFEGEGGQGWRKGDEGDHNSSEVIKPNPLSCSHVSMNK